MHLVKITNILLLLKLKLKVNKKQELQEVGKFPIEIFWNIATWNFDIISFISKKFGLWKPELKETEL